MHMKMRDDLAAAVMQAHRLASSRTLWPGWDFERTPLVLHSKGLSYVVGHPKPPEGYVELEPVAGRRVHTGPTLPEMAANTAREIEGTISALVMFSEEPVRDPGEFARLILHESFHAHQLEALSAVEPPDFRVMQKYPENDPVNNAMSSVENLILCSAWQSHYAVIEPSDLTAERARTVASSFLAVRQARHHYLTTQDLADICVYEERSEFNEGTPTYIEMKAGKPVTELIDTLRQCNVAGKWAAYRRFYATGAALALLLDVLSPDWHLRMAEGRRTLRSLLAESVHSRDAEAAGADVSEDVPVDTLVDVPVDMLVDVSEVLRSYNYEGILAAEEKSAKERAAEIDKMIRELSDGPGIRVEIEVPEGAFTLFNPNKVIVVKPGVKLHPTLSGLRGAKGLVVDIACLCLEDGPGRRLVLRVPEAPVPAQPDPPITSLTAEGLTISAPQGLKVSAGSEGTYRIQFL